MSVASGKLDKFFTILRRGTQRDTANQLLDVWENYDQAWGNILQPTGRSRIENDGNQENRPRMSIRFRFRMDLDVGMRLIWVSRGVVFDIKEVAPNYGKQDWTDCVCEVVP